MLNNQEISAPVLIKDLGLMYPSEISRQKVRYGMFLCSCGNIFKSTTYRVDTKKTMSCGCYHKLMAKKSNSKHGLWNHKIYHVWNSMIGRCKNEKDNNFQDYGGRGITVCERWLDVRNFIEDMYPTYQNGLSIDRINNDGNYEPSNCRWTTRNVQARNTRQCISTNKSGYRGVSKNTRNKYSAVIYVNNSPVYLGVFEDKVEAAIAYNKYVDENNLEHTKNIIRNV